MEDDLAPDRRGGYLWGMGKGHLFIPCLAALLMGCSESEKSESEASSSEVKKRQIKRSFDPVFQESSERFEVTRTEKEKSAKSGSTAAASATKGREESLARDILKMESSVARNLAMTQLISQWAERDIDAAMAFGLTVYDDRDMKRAFHQGVAPYLSEHEPERLLEIISNGNHWEDQWIHERIALQRVAKEDFHAASEFFASTSPSKQHGEEAYRYTSKIAQEQSIEAAFAYADRLEAPKGKPAAIRAAVASWVEVDSVAASEYARDATDPLLRDHAILGLADALWQTNPEDTIAWAGAIGDGDLRVSTYTRLAESWQKAGASESLEALMASPDLSGAERAAIEQAIRPESE